MLNTVAARFVVVKAARWYTPSVLGQTPKYFAASAKVISEFANYHHTTQFSSSMQTSYFVIYSSCHDDVIMTTVVIAGYENVFFG